jgi:23S rRNA (adenine2503-C2)-methyltransferase
LLIFSVVVLKEIEMKPLLRATVGRETLAYVYLLQLDEDPRRIVETVDSIDPRYPRSEKAVIIISTQFGCPVGCLMCDAGEHYLGNLTSNEMLDQVRFIMERRPENLQSAKLKVHFARMGEPALNQAAVLEVLERLPEILPCEGLIPCISTVAPASSELFFSSLLKVKERHYAEGRFQLQFSINSTDPQVRRQLIPSPHLGLEDIASVGRPFYAPGDRKVVLNFALGHGVPVLPAILSSTFDPDAFMVKLTPVNPTEASLRHGLRSVLSAERPESAEALVQQLRSHGFDTVVSIGEADEIQIGSNCGQLVRAHRPAADMSAPPAREILL